METRDWRTALDLELENSSLLSKLSVLLGDDLSPSSLIYFLYLKSLVEVNQANISLVVLDSVLFNKSLIIYYSNYFQLIVH